MPAGQDVAQPLLRTRQTLQSQTRSKLLCLLSLLKRLLQTLRLNALLLSSQIRRSLRLLNVMPGASESTCTCKLCLGSLVCDIGLPLRSLLLHIDDVLHVRGHVRLHCRWTRSAGCITRTRASLLSRILPCNITDVRTRLLYTKSTKADIGSATTIHLSLRS